MIIPRKYEWLGKLYQEDELSRNAIDAAFDNADYTRKAENSSLYSKDALLEYNYANISAFLNLGCGIPGNIYSSFMKAFEDLDKTHPYDNGLTFKDVTNIEFETSRKGTAIQMRFVCELDGMYRIVGFSALQNNNGIVSIDKGWTMANSYTIG